MWYRLTCEEIVRFFTSKNLTQLYPIESIEPRQSIEPIECRQSIEGKIPIERNRILPRNRLFDCDSIALDNRITIIRSRSIGLIAIFIRSCSIDIVWLGRVSYCLISFDAQLFLKRNLEGSSIVVNKNIPKFEKILYDRS